MPPANVRRRSCDGRGCRRRSGRGLGVRLAGPPAILARARPSDRTGFVGQAAPLFHLAGGDRGGRYRSRDAVGRGVDIDGRGPHSTRGRHRSVVARSESRGSLGPRRNPSALKRTLAKIRAGTASPRGRSWSDPAAAGFLPGGRVPEGRTPMGAAPAEPSNRGPARPSVLVVAVIAGWSAALAYAAGHAGSRVVQVTPAVAAEVGDAVTHPAGFADVVEKIKPAVFGVKVRIDHEGEVGVTPESFGDESLPRMGRPKHAPSTGNVPRPRAETAQGAGFFISPDGYGITSS